MTTSQPHRKDFRLCLHLTAGRTLTDVFTLATHAHGCTGAPPRPRPNVDFRDGGKEGGPDEVLTNAQTQY